LAGTLESRSSPRNQSQTQITLSAAPASKFEQTYAIAEQAREIVMKNRT